VHQCGAFPADDAVEQYAAELRADKQSGALRYQNENTLCLSTNVRRTFLLDLNGAGDEEEIVADVHW
jgi:hypothetical protein